MLQQQQQQHYDVCVFWLDGSSFTTAFETVVARRMEEREWSFRVVSSEEEYMYIPRRGVKRRGVGLRNTNVRERCVLLSVHFTSFFLAVAVL